MVSRKREEYTDIKVIATVLVVAGHITRFYIPGGGVFETAPNFILGKISDWIYAFHMPLFIFVSGAVYSFNFNRCGKYRDTYLFLKGKFKRLMIPYFVWGICYVAPVMVAFNITEMSMPKYIIKCILLGGDSRHLWYLWTLFFLFVICAFIQKFSGKIKYILVAFAFIILVILYCLTKLGPFWNLLYYGTFFFAGYIFDFYKECIDQFIKRKWIPTFTSFLVIMLKFFLPGSWIINLICGGAGIIMSYFIMQWAGVKVNRMKWYLTLSRDSFGIYLIHPMLIYIVYYFCGSWQMNSYIFAVGLLVIVILVSGLLAEILRKLHLQVILGEW